MISDEFFHFIQILTKLNMSGLEIYSVAFVFCVL